jgi:CubicO group peptidase (beta-lactamase class C family)
MTDEIRSFVRVPSLFLALAVVFLISPVLALGKTTLAVVQGSGEFESLTIVVTVTGQQPLTMQWTTDEPAAVKGAWQVFDVNAGNVTVAHGNAPAPKPGHFARFTIGAAAFLKSPAPASPLKFHIRIMAYDAANHPLGMVSNLVTVMEEPPAPQPQVNFGSQANWPSVSIVSYDEKIGAVAQTQLRFAGADVTLRLSNRGKSATDPIWVGISDASLLMRQNTPKASIPSLAPGTSQTVTVHLDAILPPATSQLPEEQQYRQWYQEYRDRCGVELRATMDWGGAQAKAPMNDHTETILSVEGWENYGKGSPNAAICDSAQCVKPCQMAKNIHKELDGHVVGYSFFAGQFPKFGAFGDARAAVDGTPHPFTSKTKITIASVSKLVTAIGAVAILDKYGVSIDAPIGPYFPSDWFPSPYVKNLKFSQLLSHTSGIKDYGNVPQSYGALKKYFTQPVSNSSSTACQPAKVVDPSDSINPNNLSGCYSNYNFAIFRILLPKVAGFPEDLNPATRGDTLADQYVKLVQQYVFDPVGQHNVACKPVGGTHYAIAYNYPGDHNGYDWGDVSYQCGAAGWYLSIEDMAKVLLSINAKDGKIFKETPAKPLFQTMMTRKLGWDIVNNGELEKNGAWGAGCDNSGNHCGVVSTSAAIFGPVTGPRVIGVLFLNSNISGGTSDNQGAQQVLEKAYNSALYPKP